MHRVGVLIGFIIGCVLMQGCATSGSGATSDIQPNTSVSGSVTGQNMDYMYRSPSYQIGHM